MKIGIDARLVNETGVGRYIRNLVVNLGKADTNNLYIVFLRSDAFDVFPLPTNKWEKRRVDLPWHSIEEQIKLPSIFLRERLDLLHVPYFNIPIFYPGNMIVTMHDIIIHHMDTGKATTLPYLFYKIRRLGYHIVLSIGLRRVRKIIAVSEYTKIDLMQHFSVPSGKIDVIYQGIDEHLYPKKNAKKPLNGDYFLYVGNAYPHKNLSFLVQAYNSFFLHESLKKRSISIPKLVLVGEDDYFYQRLKAEIKLLEANDNIVFYGSVDDTTLGALYHFAIGFLYPSLIEGFGLPPIEALLNGTPVLVSDIPVFHEVLGDMPIYFQKNSVRDLVDKMKLIWQNSEKLKKLLPPARKLLQLYRWENTASATLQSYKACM